MNRVLKAIGGIGVTLLLTVLVSTSTFAGSFHGFGFSYSSGYRPRYCRSYSHGYYYYCPPPVVYYSPPVYYYYGGGYYCY
ncbi:MAG: hypothetical protein ABSA97_04225 [Verrucomicrobiia bacterium]